MKPFSEPLAPADFRAIFEASPGQYLIMDSRYNIVAATDSYLRMTMVSREQLVGKNVFEVFLENPEASDSTNSTSQLRSSLERVLRTKLMDTMSLLKYDIRRPENEGGGYEERFWKPINIPILGADGEVKYIFNRVEDVTAEIHMQRMDAAQARVLEEIRQNEKLLDQVFYESPSFMTITLGPNHVLQRANQNYYRVLGLTPEAIGKTVADVFPEIVDQGFIDLLDTVYREGRPFTGHEAPLRLVAADGSERLIYVNFSYQPIRNSDGEIYGIIHEGYEVTETVLSRQALEKAKAGIENERNNFRNLFKQTPEMVCITSGPDHVFEFVNDAHVKALGFNATGMAVRQAQPESVEVHGLLDSVYRTGITAELHEIPVTVTDRLRYFNLTYAARRDNNGQINGIMILGVEVTSEVQSRDRLATAVKARDEFLSIASHELKTPLTALRLQAQITMRNLLKGSREFFSEDRIKHFAQTLDTQVDRLTNLVEDMLDISRIQNGRLMYNFKKGHLDELVRDVVDRMMPALQTADCDFTLKLEDKIEGDFDPYRIEQVLMNLLSNAMKYGGGKPIRLELRKDDDTAILLIQDHGIGIAPEHHHRIFERFERAISANEISGLGLGLFIARQILEAHGGSIVVDSEEGQGALFTVRLPLHPPQRVEQPREKAYEF